MKILFALVALLIGGYAGFPLPAIAQNDGKSGFAELFSGGAAPLSLKLRDLNSSWRRARVSPNGGEQAESAGIMQGITAAFGGAQQPVTYYTQGRMIQLAGKTFLIAYRAEPKPLDFAALQQFSSSGAPPSPQQIMDLIAPAPTPDSTLSLTLVDMHSVGSMDGLAPFELAQATNDRSIMASSQAIQAAILFPVFAQARLKAQETSSISNLKQVALGILMYCQDWDERLPPMKDSATMKKAIYPYVKNEAIFKDPRTGEPYHVNPAASRKSEAAIESPAEFVLVFEASPAPDGTRAIAYADGHVKRIKEADWPRVRQRSGIP